MSDPIEAQAFLAANPDLEAVDLILTDSNGISRGKRLRPHELMAAYVHGRYLPGSILGLDMLGEDVVATGLVWDDGDADRLCKPVPGTLMRSPWQRRPIAQVLLSMYELDGRPAHADPRHALARAIERLTDLGYTPVVAVELEFYLLVGDSLASPSPRPVSRRPEATQVYELDAIDAVGDLLADLHRFADVQGIPSETTISEFSAGQYEITLRHRDDALRAADDAILWKRLVRGTAGQHGMAASFMAKPFTGMAGSGMHVHVSLNDARGHNAFASDDPQGTPLLRNALGGLMATMADTQAVCAPHANSYRRFRSQSYAPLIANWGVNNRSVSLRIPAGPPASRHLEHRVAGADANPYLVLALVLSAVYKGLVEQLDPGEPVTGNGYEHPGDRLPTDWAAALDRFEFSAFIREALGPDTTRVFTAIKRQEYERFGAEVTALDWAWGQGV